MTHISDTTKQLLILLEAAYEAGWKDSCNPYDYKDFWEEYKKEYLTEYESDTEEVRCGGCHMEISVCDCPRD